jgi:glutamyl-tRNA synthetase
MALFFLPAGVDPDKVQLMGKAFRDDPDRAALLLSEALVQAESIEPWTHDALEPAFRGLAEHLGVKAGDLFMLMRIAVAGRPVSPPLFETMELIGKERCVLRLREAVAIL